MQASLMRALRQRLVLAKTKSSGYADNGAKRARSRSPRVDRKGSAPTRVCVNRELQLWLTRPQKRALLCSWAKMCGTTSNSRATGLLEQVFDKVASEDACVKRVFVCSAFIHGMREKRGEQVLTKRDHARAVAALVDALIRGMDAHVEAVVDLCSIGANHGLFRTQGFSSELWERFAAAFLAQVQAHEGVRGSAEALRAWTLFIAHLTDKLRAGFDAPFHRTGSHQQLRDDGDCTPPAPRAHFGHVHRPEASTVPPATARGASSHASAKQTPTRKTRSYERPSSLSPNEARRPKLSAPALRVNTWSRDSPRGGDVRPKSASGTFRRRLPAVPKIEVDSGDAADREARNVPLPKKNSAQHLQPKPSSLDSSNLDEQDDDIRDRSLSWH